MTVQLSKIQDNVGDPSLALGIDTLLVRVGEEAERGISLLYSRLSEIFNRKRKLNLRKIRNLPEKMKISYESLLADYK